MSKRRTLAVVSPMAPSAEVEALYSHSGDNNSRNFGAYFSAFPASFWQNNTVVQEVILSVSPADASTVTLYRSSAEGLVSTLQTLTVDGGQEATFTIKLSGFDAGGWLWFTLESLGQEPPQLLSGRWETDDLPVSVGKVSLGITTLNKVDYCLANLKQLAADSELMEQVEQIIVVDQGTQKVDQAEDYPEIAGTLGAKLQMIHQPNIGGSGGFSRSMFEASQLNDTGYLLLLDDDVQIETESIRRALNFANFCTEPTVIGGHMFDLHRPTVLHAFSEIIEPKEFFWTQRNKAEEFRHDFAQQSLGDSPWFHRYFESDYTGWWMCLIPTSIIREVGLSLPFFLKWDDAEYGLRVREAGYRVISLPGAALWHVSWLDKDDPQDWQAFFHVRNRLIAAMLYSQYPGGGTLVSSGYQHSLKYLSAMQYYAVALRNEAIRSVLAGPEHFAESLTTDLPRAIELKSSFEENKKYSPQEKSENTIQKLHHTDYDEGRPTGLRLIFWLMYNLPRHYLLPALKNPIPAEFPRLQATWWRVAKYDAYIVPTADNDGTFYWFKRDRKKFLALQKENKKLTKQLKKNWSALQKRYKQAFPDLVSPEYWNKQFHGETGS